MVVGCILMFSNQEASKLTIKFFQKKFNIFIPRAGDLLIRLLYLSVGEFLFFLNIGFIG